MPNNPALTNGKYVPPGQGLARCPNEPGTDHRGLLLYAMQDPGKRSYRRVASALARQDGTIRNWSARWLWPARLEVEGEAAQARACQLYRDLYLDTYGLREHAVVEGNMSVPLIMAAPPVHRPSMVGEGTRDEVQKAQEPTPHTGRQRPHEESPAAEAARKLDRFSNLAEAVIGGFANEVQQALANRHKDPKAFGRLGVRAGDVARFVKLWQDLQDVKGTLAPSMAAHPALETSYRVTQAQKKGEDVLMAHLDDAREVLAVLETLQAAKEAAAEQLQAGPRVEHADNVVELVPGG